LNSKKISDQSLLSDHSRPVTPASLANINVFHEKYEQFEKYQLKNQEFNPIITSLIQRAEKLKTDLNKSIYTDEYKNENFSLYNDFKGDSFNEYIDDNYDLDYTNEKLNNEPSYIFENNFDFHDKPEVEIEESEDKELNELLNPTSLFLKMLGKNNQFKEEPVTAFYKREQPQRPYSANSNNSSDDENEKVNNNQNRNVSFDIQSSSDGESSIASVENDQNCVDSLGPQRLALLNLVQIAKLRIDNIDFYSSFSTQIFKSIETELQNQRSDHNRFNSKPPKAVKSDLNQLFFIEYQFPVMAGNSHHPRDDSLNATQIMRVMPKRLNKTTSLENKIQFDHNADYSVLFSPKSLENWWRSYIVFKVYLRSPQVSVKATSSPQSIGIARLKLRNLLKSRNFKLVKKLAVLDQFKQNKNSASKRIGTLNVCIELSSDLNEFLVDLQKLKNVDRLSIQSKQLKPQPPPQPKPVASKQSFSTIPVNIKTVDSSSDPNLMIDFYLSVSDGREFNSSFKNSVYLICRLFWSKEKVKLESNTNFIWTLNLSFMLNQAIIENMRNNFMIIEAWVKASNASLSDSLIGTIKLPLQEFYLKFNDYNSMNKILNDSIAYTHPVIGVNGWLSVVDPFSGFKSGELNILLAMGSNKQILNLQKILFDQSRTKLNDNLCSSTIDMKEHTFTVSLEQIKLQPSTEKNGAHVNETDYFVKYFFPNCNDFKLESFTIACKLNTNFANKIEHKILAKEKKEEFSAFILNRCKDISLISFELWKRSYFPNLREKFLAKGEMLLDKFLSLTSSDQKKETFIIPLIINDADEQKHDKFMGQLFIDVEYKCMHLFDSKIAKSFEIEEHSYHNKENNHSNIMLSIGVLRASRLQTLIKTVSLKSETRSLNLEDSEVYVKFSLSFINKPLVIIKK